MNDGIQRTKLCEDVENRIIEHIRSGEWREGSKLPSEPVLADLFEVSRATVRTAVKMLQLAGIVYSKSGSGTYVKDNASVILDTRELAAVMADAQNVYELVHARYVLEPQLCALAAKYATEDEIAALDAIVQAMERCEDRHALMAYGYRFHQAVAEFSHNRILYGFCRSIASQLRGLRVLDSLTLEVYLRGTKEHRAIAEAIAARDEAAAKERMCAHLERDYADYFGKE